MGWILSLRKPCRNVLLFLLVLSALISCSGCWRQTGSPVAVSGDTSSPNRDPVYVLNLFAISSDGSEFSQDMSTGLKAALNANPTTGADGIPIVLIEPVNTSGSVASIMDQSLHDQPNLLTVVGPSSDALLAEVEQYITAHHLSSLTAIGPYTDYSQSRGWSVNKYFLRPPPIAEVYAVLSFIASKMRVRRVGLVQEKHSQVSATSCQQVIAALLMIHQIAPIIFLTSDGNSASHPRNMPRIPEAMEETLDGFAAQKPQVIIISGTERFSTTQHFLEGYFDHSTLSQVPIFSTSRGYRVMHSNAMQRPGFHFYFTSTNLFPSDVSFSYIQLFRSELQEYLGGQQQAVLDPVPPVNGAPPPPPPPGLAGGKGSAVITNIDTPQNSATTYMDELNDMMTGGMAVYGWLVGKTLIETFASQRDVVNRSVYQDSLFNQRQYVVGGEVLIGHFGGVCNEFERLQLATCECNQGGHTVSIHSATRNAQFQVVPILEESVSFPRDLCDESLYTLPYYASVLFVQYESIPLMRKAAHVFFESFKSGANVLSKSQVLFSCDMVSVSAQMDDISDLQEYVNNYLVDIVIGPAMSPQRIAHLNTSDAVLLVDPFNEEPMPRLEIGNVVYFMPTIDQQLYVLSAMTSEFDYAFVIVFPENYEDPPAFMNVVHNAAQTYALRVDVTSIGNEPSVRRSPAHQLVVVGILREGEAAFLRSELEAHHDRTYCLFFDAFALHYSELVRTFQDADEEVLRRLITVTNLPLWSDFSMSTEEKYPVLREYHKRYAHFNETSPQTLQMWYTTGVLEEVMRGLYGGINTTLINSLYRYAVYQYGSLMFGNFLWNAGCTSGVSTQCSNYGANDMYVISLARVFNARVPPEFGPCTPEITTPSYSWININTTLAVVIPLCIFGIVLIALLIYQFCWRRSRDNDSAPKHGDRPITLMFTDIQSSTSLWASFPKEMVIALNAHHRIIREQIAKFKCYEVKTIGDSFMIASDDVLRIVRLSIAIQQALHSHNWGTLQFDDYYLEAEWRLKREFTTTGDAGGSDPGGSAAQAAGGAPQTGETWDEQARRQSHEWEAFRDGVSVGGGLSVAVPPDYERSWNGLRVRAGIHTGFCDVCLDEITKGYDYYGDTVNTAARTESAAAGGQVLMTQSTWDYLQEKASGSELDSIPVKDAGTYTLRGVPHPVQMYQVDVFPDRVFHKSAWAGHDGDAEAYVEEAEVALLHDAERNAEGHAHLQNVFADVVYRVVNGLSSTLHVRDKLERLRPLMVQWHVQSSTSSHWSDENKYRFLLTQFANRTSKVIAQREGFRDALEHTPGTSGTASEVFSVGNAVYHGAHQVLQVGVYSARHRHSSTEWSLNDCQRMRREINGEDRADGRSFSRLWSAPEVPEEEWKTTSGIPPAPSWSATAAGSANFSADERVTQPPLPPPPPPPPQQQQQQGSTKFSRQKMLSEHRFSLLAPRPLSSLQRQSTTNPKHNHNRSSSSSNSSSNMMSAIPQQVEEKEEKMNPPFNKSRPVETTAATRGTGRYEDKMEKVSESGGSPVTVFPRVPSPANAWSRPSRRESAASNGSFPTTPEEVSLLSGYYDEHPLEKAVVGGNSSPCVGSPESFRSRTHAGPRVLLSETSHSIIPFGSGASPPASPHIVPSCSSSASSAHQEGGPGRIVENTSKRTKNHEKRSRKNGVDSHALAEVAPVTPRQEESAREESRHRRSQSPLLQPSHTLPPLSAPKSPSSSPSSSPCRGVYTAREDIPLDNSDGSPSGWSRGTTMNPHGGSDGQTQESFSHAGGGERGRLSSERSQEGSSATTTTAVLDHSAHSRSSRPRLLSSAFQPSSSPRPLTTTTTIASSHALRPVPALPEIAKRPRDNGECQQQQQQQQRTNPLAPTTTANGGRNGLATGSTQEGQLDTRGGKITLTPKIFRNDNNDDDDDDDENDKVRRFPDHNNNNNINNTNNNVGKADNGGALRREAEENGCGSGVHSAGDGVAVVSSSVMLQPGQKLGSNPFDRDSGTSGGMSNSEEAIAGTTTDKKKEENNTS